MKTITSFILLGSSLFSLNAFAQGASVGNGGEVIICYNQEVTKDGSPLSDIKPLDRISTRLLDFWEWGSEIPHPISMGESYDPIQKVLCVLERFGKHDLYTSNLIKSAHQNLLFNLTDDPIPQARDRKARLPRPSNCIFKTIAYQAPIIGSDVIRRVDVDRQIYDQLSSDDKAGLRIHEALLASARTGFDLDRGETSDPSRRFNYLISSTEIEHLTKWQYIDAVDQYGLHFLEPFPGVMRAAWENWLEFEKER